MCARNPGKKFAKRMTRAPPFKDVFDSLVSLAMSAPAVALGMPPLNPVQIGTIDGTGSAAVTTGWCVERFLATFGWKGIRACACGASSPPATVPSRASEVGLK
ncbi:hypothetical protein VitviT2T_020229 [Vitis vinifera]|uniref:Uncharacterized protein n=1 Tax=Vitis vinifera TaxID=29760 RepID=A0ABY9D3B0_VITVI|nr:hypothetical protein VitviT2T_020229 [Vitis vinifera]